MRRVKMLLAVAIALVAIYNLLPEKPFWLRVAFTAANAAAGIWFYRVISQVAGDEAADETLKVVEHHLNHRDR